MAPGKFGWDTFRANAMPGATKAPQSSAGWAASSRRKSAALGRIRTCLSPPRPRSCPVVPRVAECAEASTRGADASASKPASVLMQGAERGGVDARSRKGRRMCGAKLPQLPARHQRKRRTRKPAVRCRTGSRQRRVTRGAAPGCAASPAGERFFGRDLSSLAGGLLGTGGPEAGRSERRRGAVLDRLACHGVGLVGDAGPQSSGEPSCRSSSS